MLSDRDFTGIIGTGNLSGHRFTLSGLVPDGNPTITLVLANGARTRVAVIDNVYEATVPGQVVAVILRTTAGHIQRHGLTR